MAEYTPSETLMRSLYVVGSRATSPDIDNYDDYLTVHNRARRIEENR